MSTDQHPSFAGQLFKPNLAEAVFFKVNKAGKPDSVEGVLAEPLFHWVHRCEVSGIQEGVAARNVWKARHLAYFLVNGEGRIDFDGVHRALRWIENHFYVWGSSFRYDAHRQAHFYRVLRWFVERKNLVDQIERFVEPQIEEGREWVRATLLQEGHLAVTSVETKRAVVASLLTLLRQNVGSCFATAPGIVIHTQYPEQFLADLDDLFTRGELYRVIQGKEVRVPMSHGWGMGDLLRPLPRGWQQMGRLAYAPGFEEALEALDLLPEGSEEERIAWVNKIIMEAADGREIGSADQLLRVVAQDVSALAKARHAFVGVTDNAILKGWEFTLASFAEAHAQFSQWNLYASLGLNPQEPGGIGAILHEAMEEELERLRDALQEIQGQDDALLVALRQLELRLRGGDEWTKSEYRMKREALYALREEAQKLQAKGTDLTHLFSHLIERYAALFPRYFQEVYDAEMREVEVKLYDDTAAGFRLVYKHGRMGSSLWEPIDSPEAFSRALHAFFSAAEIELRDDPELERWRTELDGFTTKLIQHIHRPEFLETALNRMARAHGLAPIARPLDHLDQVVKKPWAYISGGTMTTLVSAYFSRKEGPTLKGRQPKHPTDLALFFLETMKEADDRITARFLNDPQASLLIQSPTHGFCLKPGLPLFREGWLDEGNTYTWLRDRIIRPGLAFAETTFFDSSMEQAFLLALEKHLPPIFQQEMKFTSFQRGKKGRSLIDFRRQLNELLEKSRFSSSFRLMPMIDALLYRLAPFTSSSYLRSVFEALLPLVLEEQAKQGLDWFDHLMGSQVPPSALSSEEVASMTLAISMLTLGETHGKVDLEWKILAAMRHLGLASPAPLLVADTNWSRDFFGFVVNPGTGDLDFWRFDYLSLGGSPMDLWKNAFYDPSVPWSIYINPSEYQSSLSPS